MTDREKAIVMAYTGYTMLSGDKLGIYYKYVQEKLGRSVMTHELAYQEVQDAIKEAAKEDFIAIAKADNGWVSVKDRMPEQAGKRYLVCAKYGNNKNAVFIACIGYGSGEWETLDCRYMAKVRNPRDKKVHSAYVVTHWMPLPEPPKEVSE